MALIGRDQEQRQLKSAWGQAAAGAPQLVVVWGRRRVGKTFLLTDFARERRAFYFTATRQDSEERQLARFTERLAQQLGETALDAMTGPFQTWEAALRYTARLAENEPLLVVIDEAPRLNSAAGDFGDVVSAFWENQIQTQHLMLVLSGSAVTVMEDMLGPQGGLHRRPHVELRMDPFGFRDAAQFLPQLNGEDFVQAYAASGGYPLHLRRWNTDATPAENLLQHAFTPGGLLLRDAPDILSEDLDWRGGYERVLAAMAGGARRRSRIAGRAQQRIDYTLARLRKAGYVRPVRSVGSPATADALYEVADVYLSFWLTVLREDADLIEGDQGSAVQRRTEGRWHRHVANVLESAAREHCLHMVKSGELPGEAIVGRWWRDEVAEIDVCALLPDGDPALIGECKWQAKPMTTRDLNTLRQKAALIGRGSPLFAMWARGGAAELADAYADVRSYTCDDLLP